VDEQQRILCLTEDNFDEEIKRRKGPILVDFWAAWCEPCTAIFPSLRAIAEEFGDRAHVAQVDVDEHGDLANRFGVRSIPTLVVFKGGRVVDRMIGAAPEEQIRRLLQKHTG